MPKYGPNMVKLVCARVASLVVPPGPGQDPLTSVVGFFGDPVQVARVTREAEVWAAAAVASVKRAPGNPHGDDEEAIAGEILARVEAKKQEQARARRINQ